MITEWLFTRGIRLFFIVSVIACSAARGADNVFVADGNFAEHTHTHPLVKLERSYLCDAISSAAHRGVYPRKRDEPEAPVCVCLAIIRALDPRKLLLLYSSYRHNRHKSRGERVNTGATLHLVTRGEKRDVYIGCVLSRRFSSVSQKICAVMHEEEEIWCET